MTIDTSRIDALASLPAPLYELHPGECAPQHAYLDLTTDGILYADYDSYGNNGVPFDVWHNRTLRFPLPAEISGKGLGALVTRLLPLLERVHAGHDEEWDGSNCVGRLTDDASEARDAIDAEIARSIDETDLAQVWDTSEWIAMVSLSELWPDGKSLAEAAADVEAGAEADGVYLTTDVADTLRDRLLSDYEHNRLDDHLPPAWRAVLEDEGYEFDDEAA